MTETGGFVTVYNINGLAKQSQQTGFEKCETRLLFIVFARSNTSYEKTPSFARDTALLGRGVFLKEEEVCFKKFQR